MRLSTIVIYHVMVKIVAMNNCLKTFLFVGRFIILTEYIFSFSFLYCIINAFIIKIISDNLGIKGIVIFIILSFHLVSVLQLSANREDAQGCEPILYQNIFEGKSIIQTS